MAAREALAALGALEPQPSPEERRDEAVLDAVAGHPSHS
jgi:hypothetical protein